MSEWPLIDSLRSANAELATLQENAAKTLATVQAVATAMDSDPAVLSIRLRMDAWAQQISQIQTAMRDDDALRNAEQQALNAKTAVDDYRKSIDAVKQQETDDPVMKTIQDNLTALENQKADLAAANAVPDDLLRKRLSLQEDEARFAEAAAQEKFYGTPEGRDLARSKGQDAGSIVQQAQELQRSLQESLPKLKDELATMEDSYKKSLGSPELQAATAARQKIEQQEIDLDIKKQQADLAARKQEFTDQLASMDAELKRREADAQALADSYAADKKRYDDQVAALQEQQRAAQEKLDKLQEQIAGKVQTETDKGNVVLGGFFGGVARQVDASVKQVTDGSHAMVDVLNESGGKAKTIVAGHVSALQALTIKATQEVQKVTDTAAQQVNTTMNGVSEVAATTAANVVASMGAAQQAAQTTFDMYKHGPNGVPLEEFVAHQKDKIAAIENTAFGGYLDEYAYAYEQYTTNRSKLSAQQIIDFEKTLQGTSDIIKNFTGEAGRTFNFDQFKRDLDAIMKTAKAVAATPLNGGKPGGGTQNTGAAGSPNTPTQTGGNLSIGNWSGGLP